MRLSAVPLVSALAIQSVSSASIPGIDKLTTDLTTLVTSLTTTPIDATKVSTGLQNFIYDAFFLALGAGGINTGSTLTPASATAVVTQITDDVCNSLSTVKNATSTLSTSTSALAPFLTGSVSTVVNSLQSFLNNLPQGVNVTAARTCLNAIAPSTSTTKLARTGGATIPKGGRRI